MTSGSWLSRCRQPLLLCRRYLAGGSHVQDGIRTTVMEFRNAGSAGSKAGQLILKAYNARRESIVCDLHKQPLSVAGMPGARGIVVDNRTRNGSSHEDRDDRVHEGPSSPSSCRPRRRPGSLRVGQLKREARRAYRAPRGLRSTLHSG